MNGTYYGKEVDLTNADDIEDINTFVTEGTPTILVDDLSDLSVFDIDPDEVKMVNE